MGYYRNRFSSSQNRRWSWGLEKDGSMIKYAEIHKIKIETEIRYIAKMYVTYRDEMIDSFSSSYLEKVVEYLISEEYVITNYFDMTEWRNNKKWNYY